MRLQSQADAVDKAGQACFISEFHDFPPPSEISRSQNLLEDVDLLMFDRIVIW